MSADPKDLRIRAAEKRAEAAELLEGAEELERAAAVLEKDGLRPAMNSASIVRVTESQVVDARRKASAKKGGLHPFQAWLYARPTAPRSSTELAESLGITDQRVRSWFRLVDNVRVTAETAEEIARRWGFAATLENWPNGIKPHPRRPRPRKRAN